MIYYSFVSKNCEREVSRKLLEYAWKIENKDKEMPQIYKNKYGKPYFENCGYYFNISHCTGMAVCAFAKYEIGVDCEQIGRMSGGAVRKIFSDSERQIFESAEGEFKAEYFMRVWTFKEACGKALGRGLSTSFKNYTAEESHGILHISEKITYEDKSYIITAAALSECVFNEKVVCVDINMG